MPEGLGHPDHDSEYPEYTEAGGEGVDRFAPPTQVPVKRGWRTTNNRVPSPTQAPSAVPAPPLESLPAPDPRDEPPANPFGTPPPSPPTASEHGTSARPTSIFDRSDNDYVNPKGYLAPTGTPHRREPLPPAKLLIRAVIWIAIVAAIVTASVLVNNTRGSSTPSGGSGSGTSSGTSSGSGSQPQVPNPGVTPATKDPTSFEEAIVEFDEFTVNGRDSHTFDLPDGVTNGVIDIAYNGGSYMNLTSYDKKGNYYESILWGTSSGQLRTTAIFGRWHYDGKIAASIEVSTRGDWSLTFRPLSTLAPLPDSYSQADDFGAAFLYEGPGELVEVVFEPADDAYAHFSVNQENLIDSPADILRLSRAATTLLHLDPGPNIIVVDPYGASSWSITKK